MEKQVCDNCTGCGACFYKCPKAAISFALNVRKEYIAIINQDLCVNCNLCRKVCPQLNKIPLNTPKTAYAAWTMDDRDYNTTSSGGIGTTLSKAFINDNGVVYGASFTNNGLVHHIRVDTIEEIELLKGSKYIQSDFRSIFKDIEKDIKNNKKVLIIGTPCQISAIRSCFTIEQMKDVYLVDLVCHGTPPENYFEDYLKEIILDRNSPITVSFRKKGYKLTIGNREKIIYKKKYELDPYYRSFMYGLIFRDNCYTCKYACGNRIGDITLCDFWGLNRNASIIKYPEFVSCIFINTEKGEDMFNTIQGQCQYEQRDIEEAVAGNTNLQHASYRHKDRDRFLSCIKQGDSFMKAIKQTSIKGEINKCKIMDLLKGPYRILKYGKWRGN